MSVANVDDHVLCHVVKLAAEEQEFRVDCDAARFRSF